MNNLQEKEKTSNSEKLSEDQQILKKAENIIREFTVVSKQKKKRKIVALLPLFILIVMGLFFSTIFSVLNINKTTILDGVYIKGLDVSGLSIDEAKYKLTSNFDNLLSKEITLHRGDYSAVLIPSQFGFTFDIDSAVESAYSVGRSSNVFKNNYQILNALTGNLNIMPSLTYDADLFDKSISEINSKIPNAVIQPAYSIDGDTLIITNGKNGVIVNSESLLNDIVYSLSNTEVSELNIPVIETIANKIDIDSIYKSIYKDATDAHYTTNPYSLYPSSTGLDFAISLDEARALVNTYQEEYKIALKTLYPKVTTNQIGTEAFPDLLSEFTTSYVSSNYNRSTNIELSSAHINGTVVMPGEEFSYNYVVGKRTAAAGFKEAGAYAGGKVVQEVGGGICQVSSTLYNAVLYANLEIVDRSNHCFTPTYVKAGLDATVSWGGPEFIFKNNRDYPIKIMISTAGKKVHVMIYGLKKDDDYRVVLSTEYLATVYATTVYETDSSLAKGATRVISSGSNGCKVAAYKNLYDKNNNFISKILLSKDTYNAHNKTIAIGR